MKHESSARMNLLNIFLLAIITLISSIPFVTKYLYHIDSANFALGMNNYDISLHQPHPPGYPLYIFFGRIVNYFLNDANRSLITITIILAVIGVIFFYLSIFSLSENRLLSLISTLFFLSNPIFWFHREVALTYTADAMASIIVFFSVYSIVFKEKNSFFYLLCFTLGFIGGFRPSLMVLLAPLAFFSIFFIKRKHSKTTSSILKFDYRVLGIGALIFLFSFCVWFLPMVYKTGGFQNYFQIIQAYTSSTARKTSILSNAPAFYVRYQMKYFWKIFLASIGGILLPLILGAYYLVKYNKTFSDVNILQGKRKPIIFLAIIALLLLPALLVFLFVHFAYPYILIMVPAFYLLATFGMFYFLKSKLRISVLFMLLGMQISMFLFLPPIGLPGRYLPGIEKKRNIVTEALAHYSRWLLFFNKNQLAMDDRKFGTVYSAIIDYVSQSGCGKDGILIITPWNLDFHIGDNTYVNELYSRHIDYYFPDIRNITIVMDKGSQTERKFSNKIKRLIVVAQKIDSNDMPRPITLKKAGSIYTADISGIGHFSFLGTTFVRSAASRVINNPN